MWPFNRHKAQTDPIETRASGTGFTAQVMSARHSHITGSSGVAELTAAVQACITLWEGGLSLADVQGAPSLDRHVMAMAARSLALRGEAVYLIRGDFLIPVMDWDLSTRNGIPNAYRVSIAEAGGATTETVLAGEVLHFRIGSEPSAPWAGQAPLRRASITSGMLQEVETALLEIYQNAPLASQIVPFPETAGTDLDTLGAGFRGQRGRVMLRESTQVSAAGGAAPHTDWKPLSVTPDLAKALPREMLADARLSVMGCFGVLPSLFDRVAQGPLVREAQRHLAGWVLQPMAVAMAEEASRKLGADVQIDTLRPLQAYDVGGRARALGAVLKGLSEAKEKGIAQSDIQDALTLVNWGDGDRAA